MKSKKINTDNVQGGNLAEITEQLIKDVPKNGTLLDKSRLPSKGRFYPDNIYVKKMSPLDVKNISSMNSENMNNVINTIFSNCISGIETNKILEWDKIWFLFYIRSLTYDDFGYSIKYKCDECKTEGLHEYHLKDLKVNYIKDEFTEMKANVGGYDITFKFVTIGDTITCLRLKKADPSEIGNVQIDGPMLDVSCFIDTINGKKMKLLPAYEWITTELDAVSFSKLAHEMSKYTFGAMPVAVLDCACGNEVHKQLELSPTFFLPNI